MKAFWTLVGSILVLVVVSWYLLNYVFISEEQRILRVIEKARLSVESGSIFSLNNVLSSKYQHANGADRAIVLRGLQQMFNETENREILLGSINIDINGDQANALVHFSFDAKLSNNNSFYQRYIKSEQMNKIYVGFLKEQQGWLIVHTKNVN